MAVDVEAAESVLDELPMQRRYALIVEPLRFRGPGLDYVEGGHEEGTGAAGGVDHPEVRHGFRVAPVDESSIEREARQHQGREVLRIERALALRRRQDAVVQRSRVVVAEFAQRVGDAVRALDQAEQGVRDDLPPRQRADVVVRA